MNEFPDSNGNGIPDAFENRPSIREILNPETVRLENKMENGEHTEADVERAYGVYVPPQKNAVLLEVRMFYPASTGACLFRSRQQLFQLIGALEAAGADAFEG